LSLGLVVYLPGLPGDLVFDDFSSIAGNPAVTVVHHGFAEFFNALFSAPVGGLLRPISMLSFMLNVQFTGLSTLGFKLTNILIHLACGFLLGFLAREIFRIVSARRLLALDETSIGWLSLATATLWTVHPLNLTAVLYVVQRETSLSALFSVAAMLSYLIGRRHGLKTWGSKLLFWLGTPFCTLLGILCKETAALVPVYLLVIEFTLLEFHDRDGKLDRQVVGFFTVFLALPLLIIGTLAISRPSFFFASYVGRDFTPYQRVLSECRILLDYLRWTFLPDLRQLGLYHDDIPASRGLLQPLTTLPSVMIVIGLLASAVACRRRTPLFSLAVLWFFGGQLMESTVLPLELAFEHRNYLPIFGILLGCTGGLYGLAGDTANRRLAAAALVAACLLLASVTGVRSMDWHSELDFARSEARHHPQSPRAVTELQWAYMNYVTSTGDKRLIPAAVSAAEQAKQLDPGSINQDVGLAYMYAQIGDLEGANTRLQMAAVRAYSSKPTATLQLALQSLLTLTSQDYRPIFASIRAVYHSALANPRVSAEQCYAADAWNTYARFQEDSGQVPDALAAMHRAVDLCPGRSPLRYNMANMLLHYGDAKDARPEIEAMRRIDDFRFQGELAALETEYHQQTGTHP
jgi:tetratricopeptide (TPR) repeat protein